MQKQCEQITLACATTGSQCKSRGIEKDCELKQDSFNEEAERAEVLRPHFLKMQAMLNEAFPLPAPEPVKQCSCHFKKSGLNGVVMLFAKKDCPVHNGYSQLQGHNNWDDLPESSEQSKQKSPWVFPSLSEGSDYVGSTPGLGSELMYNFIKNSYENYLKST